MNKQFSLSILRDSAVSNKAITSRSENLGTTPLLGTFPSYLADDVFSPRKSLQAVFSLGLMKTAVDEIIRETLAYVKDFCVLYSLRS